jgi:hypothetical protein
VNVLVSFRVSMQVFCRELRSASCVPPQLEMEKAFVR